MRGLVDNYGMEILENSHRLKSLISDLCADDSYDKDVFSFLLKNNYGKNILTLSRGSDSKKAVVNYTQNFAYKYNVEVLIPIAQAFYYAVSGIDLPEYYFISDCKSNENDSSQRNQSANSNDTAAMQIADEHYSADRAASVSCKTKVISLGRSQKLLAVLVILVIAVASVLLGKLVIRDIKNGELRADITSQSMEVIGNSVKFDNEQNAIDNYESTDISSGNTYNLGDTIFFGAIDQDGDLSNGAEPIEWLIVDKDHEHCLLISKYAIESLSYNNALEDVSWTDCSLRYWLNNDFLYSSFSAKELNTISDVRSPLGDRVFVLSIDEASEYFTTASARRTSATKTAIAHGAYQENGVCGWWLRDMGDTNRIAARVNKYGEIVTYDSTEGGVERTDYSVRPAMWITIS